jgi:hypothetical protein
MIALQPTSGTAKSGWTTAASVLDPVGLVTLPPNYLTLNKTMRTRVFGYIGTTTAQPTFTFVVAIATIAAFSTGAVTTTTTAHTTVPFELEIITRVTSIGSGTSAHLTGMARLCGLPFVVSGAVGDATASMTTLIMPNSAPAEGTGFDSTIANILDFYVACQTSSTSNNIRIYHYSVEALN